MAVFAHLDEIEHGRRNKKTLHNLQLRMRSTWYALKTMRQIILKMLTDHWSISSFWENCLIILNCLKLMSNWKKCHWGLKRLYPVTASAGIYFYARLSFSLNVLVDVRKKCLRTFSYATDYLANFKVFLSYLWAQGRDLAQIGKSNIFIK